MDGKVVIGTELNTTDFDKDISKIEKRLDELDKKSREPIKIDDVIITGTTNLTDEEIDEYNDLQQKLQELYNQKTELNKVEKAITQELNNQEAIIDKQKSSAQEQVSNNSSNESKILKMSDELEDMVREYNAIQKSDIISSKDLSRVKKLKKDIKKIAKKIEKLGGGKISIRGITDIPKQFDGIDTGLTKTIKKVAKWGLAIFGVRSAYMAVRSAMSTISQYEDGIKNNIDYIKYALAYTLKPIVEWILNAVVKLLQYVNYIAKAWTGKNLFKTADAFKNAQKNAKGLNKELQKTTASFDEMNVLQDTKSGSGADIATPNIDLIGMQGEVPEWLKWIVDNKDLILSVFAGVTVGLLAWKLGLTGIQSLGIGSAIAGIVYAIQSIIEYLQDPSWENFGKIITGIGIAVAGVAIIFGAWPIAIAGAIVAVIGIIVSNWEKIKAFFQGGIDWLVGKSEWVHKMFGDLLGGVYDSFVTILQNVLNIFDHTFNMLKGILDGIILFVKGVFTGNWKQAWKGLVQIFSSVFNGLVGIAKNVLSIIWNLVKSIALTVAQVTVELFKTVVNGVLKVIETVLNTPIKTINKLIGVINKVPGINLGKLPTFKLPRLAKGGIINQPGRGIPVGSAIGGERGQEGVLPLTDSQQMQLLGEAIGRYVTINANITNTMNGRVISRELQKVNNTNDFAFNR